LVALSKRFKLILGEIELVLLPFNQTVELFNFGLHFTLCVQEGLMRRLQLFVLALQICLRHVVSGPAIFELRVKSPLHLSLLQKHLLPDLIDCFLVFNGHGIRNATNFLPRLRQIALNMVSLNL